MSRKLTYANVFSCAKGLGIATALFSISLTAVDVGMRQYTGNLIDALTADAIRKFNWIALGVMAVLLVVLNFILPYTRTRLANRVQEGLYTLLESKALRTEQRALGGIDPGEASTYFASDTAGIAGYVNRIAGKGLPDVFTFLFSTAVLCRINLWLGIAAVAASILPVVLMFLMSRALVHMGERYQGVIEKINQKISGYFYNLELVKANTMEEAAIRENSGLLDNLLREKRAQARREAALSLPTMLSAFLTILLLSALGGYFVLQGSMQIGQLFTAITLADYVVSPVMRFENTISQIRRAKANFNRINQFLALPDETEPADYVRTVNRPGPVSLAVSGLQFTYPNGKRVFDRRDFLWEQGKLHGIVGENGAGKSTLLKLLSGVYLPQGGSVLLRGKGLPESLTRQELREQIVVDTQKTVLFPGTVRYNLTLGRRLPDEKIEAACKAVGFDKELGMDTILGEGGSPLSGGQKRRLCLARALLREAPVYIFDEPTTGIDPEHIRAIITTLQALAAEKLVIVLTHEPMLIQAVHTITELEAGK